MTAKWNDTQRDVLHKILCGIQGVEEVGVEVALDSHSALMAVDCQTYTPASGTGAAIDTDTNNEWHYFNGQWN